MWIATSGSMTPRQYESSLACNGIETRSPYDGEMSRYLLQVQLPDRPGALGAVASRIGAVGGDIIAVDILTRGEETAIDEFVVELEGDHLVSLLLSEIHEVDGADVVEVRPIPSS